MNRADHNRNICRSARLNMSGLLLSMLTLFPLNAVSVRPLTNTLDTSLAASSDIPIVSGTKLFNTVPSKPENNLTTSCNDVCEYSPPS